jgi:hypothetical protein
LFGIVVVANLIASSAAHAVCKSPKNICKHFNDCLQRSSDLNNKDADEIRAGLKARNGQMVFETPGSPISRRRENFPARVFSMTVTGRGTYRAAPPRPVLTGIEAVSA